MTEGVVVTNTLTEIGERIYIYIIYIYMCVCICIRDVRYTGLEKYRYILYFKQYDIIILLNSVFHTATF